MIKLYRGSSIFLGFISGLLLTLTVLSAWALNLGLLNFSLISIALLMFFLILLVAIYRTGRVFIRRERKIGLHHLMPKFNLGKNITNDLLKTDGLKSKEEKEDKEDKGRGIAGGEFKNDTEYNYVASTKGNVYHRTECRLAKLINPRFRAYNKTEEFFEKRKYKPCRLCIK